VALTSDTPRELYAIEKMAYRLISHHRGFFSPYYIAGTASRINTAVTRRVTFDVASQQDFEEKILNSEKPVVVDFHATWCQPCKMLAPRLKAAMETVGDTVDFAKVDIDELTDIAMEYGVTSVPTVAAFKNGKLADQFVGLIEQEKIQEFVNKTAEND